MGWLAWLLAGKLLGGQPPDGAAPAQEPSLTDLEPQASSIAADGSVTLATFRQLLDTLAQQQAGIEELLPSADVGIIRVNVTGLKQALLPWPKSRLQELQQLLPQLASGEYGTLLHMGARSCPSKGNLK